MGNFRLGLSSLKLLPQLLPHYATILLAHAIAACTTYGTCVRDGNNL